jgi:hypothetical protein
MTTGIRRPALGAILASLLALALPAGDAQTEFDLTRLMQELRQVKSARARFVESKQIAILMTPLESSGTLLYIAPRRLEKHVLFPRRESVILDGDTLVLESKDTGKRRTLLLQEHPVAWAFAEGLRSTLAGDLETLRRFYDVSLEGSRARWELRLKPTEPRLKALVSEIVARGSDAWIDAIEVQEAGGDRAVMTITRDAA